MIHTADIHAAKALIQSGQTHPKELMGASIEAARSVACQNAFVSTRFDSVLHEVPPGPAFHRPLGGLAISVKDLFDVKGEVTKAGSRVLDDGTLAAENSVAVQRLTEAGGIILGRTNMSEFAYSGVGTNPHFGTPVNACSKSEQRIPGGSSSGAAVSVATGAAFVGLGSDTGGSIRIPAALNGIVGFKSTARLVPTQGAVPLSTTLDTVCAMTRSVMDAILVHEILANVKVCRSMAPLSHYRLGVPSTLMLDELDAPVSRAWERTLNLLSRAGATIEHVEIPEINSIADLQANGGFSAAESYAWHYKYLNSRPNDYDPRVKARIMRGSTISAKEYIDLQAARTQWIQAINTHVEKFDAMISPTVPLVAPLISTVAPGTERDEAFFSLNSRLLRNPSVVNMYDGCAISIPCHVPDELPVGLMVWAGAMCDDRVLNIAHQIELTLDDE